MDDVECFVHGRCHGSMNAAAPGGIFTTRNISELPPQIQIAQRVISLQDHTLSPVGSAKYQVHRYPGDVDNFEVVEGCCNRLQFLTPLIVRIQQIIDAIHEHRVILADFKAGNDDRYDIYTGHNRNGLIDDYNESVVEFELTNLLQQDLISSSMLTHLLTLARNPNVNNWSTLTEQLRQWRIVRWREDDIRDSYVALGANRLLTLFTALSMKSVVKIDLWVPTEERGYVEVTNWILLKLTSPDGEEQLTAELGDYVKSLSRDIEIYKSGGNYMKALKRCWSLGVAVKDTTLLKLIAPIFSSETARLQQIYTDIETNLQVRGEGVGDENVITHALENVRRRLEKYPDYRDMAELANINGNWSTLLNKLYARINEEAAAFWGNINWLTPTING